MSQRITIAGNIVVDKIKSISVYPTEGMLCDINSVHMGVGGCVPNTAICLKRLDKDLKVNAIGRIGKDVEGSYVKDTLEQYGIDISNITIDPLNHTSYTDVMTTNEGTRTFFHSRGANAYFSLEDIEFDKIDCHIFHIGYALLLDSLDKKNDIYGTNLAKVLHDAKSKGFLTSLDVVSEEGKRYKELIPALTYCDYLIINEVEGGKIAGVDPRDFEGKILPENLKIICTRLLEMGVAIFACIHCPEGGVLMRKNGNYTQMNSLDLPKDYIKGSVGAGDCFCAGTLYAVYNNYSDSEILRFASLVAACNLSQKDSTSGIVEKAETWLLETRYPRQSTFI